MSETGTRGEVATTFGECCCGNGACADTSRCGRGVCADGFCCSKGLWSNGLAWIWEDLAAATWMTAWAWCEARYPSVVPRLPWLASNAVLLWLAGCTLEVLQHTISTSHYTHNSRDQLELFSNCRLLKQNQFLALYVCKQLPVVTKRNHTLYEHHKEFCTSKSIHIKYYYHETRSGSRTIKNLL